MQSPFDLRSLTLAEILAAHQTRAPKINIKTHVITIDAFTTIPRQYSSLILKCFSLTELFIICNCASLSQFHATEQFHTTESVIATLNASLSASSAIPFCKSSKSTHCSENSVILATGAGITKRKNGILI